MAIIGETVANIHDNFKHNSRSIATIHACNFITQAQLGPAQPIALKMAIAPDVPLQLGQLPPGVVAGPALIDFSTTAEAHLRSSIALAMLFASHAATAQASAMPSDNADAWLERYTANLDQLGFARTGHALVDSRFDQTGVAVHRAIIPFLTVALGGETLGPVLLAGLRNLSEEEANAPWIALFDRQCRRFSAQEMHFATVSSSPTQTSIRYAIARLGAKLSGTGALFARVTRARAHFHSATTTMTASNALLSAIQPELQARLENQARTFIQAAFLGHS